MSDIVRNQDPVALPPSATIRDACRCMRERRVGAVLVTEDDRRLLGIFTGRDAVHRVLAEGRSAVRTKLAEVMTRDPNPMPPGKTAIEALRLMENGRYAMCRSLTATRSWALFHASISPVSSWIASTRRLACGSGSDGRSQRTTTTGHGARLITLCAKVRPARSIVSAVALLIGRSETSRMRPPSTSTWWSSRRSRLVPSSTAQANAGHENLPLAALFC